jgi:hypothetical protein
MTSGQIPRLALEGSQPPWAKSMLLDTGWEGAGHSQGNECAGPTGWEGVGHLQNNECAGSTGWEGGLATHRVMSVRGQQDGRGLATHRAISVRGQHAIYPPCYPPTLACFGPQ